MSETYLNNIKEFMQRLRGIYVVPVNDGCGLLNGKDTFTRTFQTVPIQHDAADTIEKLLSIIDGLAGQQAMADDWWQKELEELGIDLSTRRK